MALTPRARRVGVTALALFASLLTARLGFWQLDRAEARQAMRDAIVAQGTRPPLWEPELARSAEAAASQLQRRAEVRGHWMPGRTVFLDNRSLGGVAGFIVVTPFRLSSGGTIVVQRGWLPRDPVDRQHLPELSTPTGELTLKVRVVDAPSHLFELGAASSGPIRQNLVLAAFATEIGEPLLPFSLQQQQPEAGGDRRLQRQWAPAEILDPTRNRAYAFQWFSFSALIAGLYVWFQILRHR